MKKITDFIIDFWVPALIIAVYLGASLFESTNYRTDGPWIRVHNGAKILSVFGTDTVVTPLNVNDSVRFIGYYGDSYKSEYLVETSEGVHGTMPVWMLDMPLLIASGPYQRDVVRLNNPDKVVRDKYGFNIPSGTDMTGVLSNGDKVGIKLGEDLYPDIPDFLNYKINGGHQFTKIMSVSKFNRLADNIAFEKVIGELGPIQDMAPVGPGEFAASFRTYVFNKEDGRFYKPVVTFNADSVAVSTSLSEASDRSYWALKFIPLASAIYDMPMTSFFARSDIYDTLLNAGGLMTTGDKIIHWIRWTVCALGALLWLIAFGVFFLEILTYVVEYHPGVFKFLSDGTLQALYCLVLIVVYYYWAVVLLAWGAYWWMVPVIVGVAVFLFNFYAGSYRDVVPHYRCPQCRHIGTIELFDQNLLDSETKTETNTRSHVTGEDTKRWKTWTKVTDTSTGFSWRENEEDHYETTTHYRDDHYREKVKYDHSMVHYKCTNCGYKERDRSVQRTVLDSKYLGSDSYTTHHSSED